MLRLRPEVRLHHKGYRIKSRISRHQLLRDQHRGMYNLPRRQLEPSLMVPEAYRIANKFFAISSNAYSCFATLPNVNMRTVAAPSHRTVLA